MRGLVAKHFTAREDAQRPSEGGLAKQTNPVYSHGSPSLSQLEAASTAEADRHRQPTMISDVLAYSRKHGDYVFLVNRVFNDYSIQALAETDLAEYMCRALEDPAVGMGPKHWIISKFWNFSNRNADKVIGAITRHLKLWNQILNDPVWKRCHASELPQTPQRIAVSVMNNVSQRCPEPLVAAGIADSLIPLMNDETFSGRASATVAIAYLLGSKDPDFSGNSADATKLTACAELTACTNTIDILARTFVSQKPTYAGSSFSHEELAGALRNLASADMNKAALGKHIPAFISTLSSKAHVDAHNEVLEILLLLAFLEANKQTMLQENLLGTLKAFVDSTDERVRKAHAGLLFLLEEQTKQRDSRHGSRQGGGDSSHVMLSYNWDNQKTIIKLADLLKKDGFTVWLDVEQMVGSTLEAMADAIDGAGVVVVGLSPQYKASANCRLEAEYALYSRKAIIPLMMQSNYQPNGWLGMLLGAKVWYDFSSEATFDENYQNFKKGLLKEHRPVAAEKKESKDAGAASASSSSVPASAPGASTWDNARVLEWLETIGIGEHAQAAFRDEEIAGDTLAQLCKWKNTDLEFTIKTVGSALKLTTLGQVGKFFAELDKLIF
jgi:hypothetical protein